MGIAAEHPGPLTALGVRFKVSHLTDGMHTGIGTAGRVNAHGMMRYAQQCIFEHFLYGRLLPLALKAPEAATVVFKAERDALLR